MKHKNRPKRPKSEPQNHAVTKAADSSKPLAPSTQDSENSQNDAKPNKAPAQPQPSFWHEPNHWIAIATVVSAVAAVLSGYLIWLQLSGSRLDQRAWVGPTSMALPECSENGIPVFISESCAPIFGANIVNTGKTIARHVRGEVTDAVLPKGAKFVAKYPTPDYLSESVMMPNMEVTKYTPRGFGQGLPQNIVTALKHGNSILYFFGRITYEDVWGGFHKTTFCVFLEPDLRQLSACDTYNNAD